MFWDFLKRRKQDFPEFWSDYLELFKHKTNHNRTLQDLDFVIFDTETTGLNPNTDRILSIGAVRITDRKMDLSDNLDLYLSQDSFNKEAVLIHGIVRNGKEEKKGEVEAIQEFTQYCGNSILVGHNVAFDISIMNAALKKMNCGKLKNKTLDTAKLAIRADGLSRNQIVDPSMYTLDALCDRYNIKKSQRHTASGDAFITAILLMKLMKKLEMRGVKTARDIFKKRIL